MLYTNLVHLETAAEFSSTIEANESVVVVCGTMGPESVPVYRIAESLAGEYSGIRFCDLEYDNPESAELRRIIETELFSGFPYVIYFRFGKIVKISSGDQSREHMAFNINELLVTTEKV